MNTRCVCAARRTWWPSQARGTTDEFRPGTRLPRASTRLSLRLAIQKFISTIRDVYRRWWLNLEGGLWSVETLQWLFLSRTTTANTGLLRNIILHVVVCTTLINLYLKNYFFQNSSATFKRVFLRHCLHPFNNSNIICI